MSAPTLTHWQTTRFRLSLQRPLVMGIVNVTPDSFSDGGRWAQADAAIAHCRQLMQDGADILDIGGESTRPGSPAVSAAVELQRVMPVLQEAVRMGCAVSVDTSKAEVMRAALALDVDIVNDVRALRDPGAMQAVAAHAACGVCLMHMHRDPQTMQTAPMEGDALPQVRDFLLERSAAAGRAGITRERIVWDYGIGFGKTLEQNFALLARQAELLGDGYPLLAGWSRKGTLGKVTGFDIHERMVPSVAAALIAVERGARVVRVHDVRETVAALKVWGATMQQQS